MAASCQWHGMCHKCEGIHPLYILTNILVHMPFTCMEPLLLSQIGNVEGL